MYLEPVNILHLLTTGLSLFGILLVWGKPNFSSLKLLLMLDIALMILNLLEERTEVRQWLLITPLFTLGFGPAIYLFCRQLTCNQAPNTKQVIHFLPMLLALSLMQWPQLIIFLGSISQAIYLLASAKLLGRYHRATQEYRSDADRLNLKWLSILLGVTFLTMLQDLLRLNLQPVMGDSLANNWYLLNTFVYLLIMGYWILMSVRQPEVFHQMARYEEIIESAIPKETDTDPEANILFAQIDELIRQQQLFRQERLSLRDLATHSGLQEKTLSWVINQGSGKNFNDYINQLRIDAVCDELQKDNPATILDIALAQGFSAKSTFNTAFKKHKGVTPSQFIKNLAQKGSES